MHQQVLFRADDDLIGPADDPSEPMKIAGQFRPQTLLPLRIAVEHQVRSVFADRLADQLPPSPPREQRKIVFGHMKIKRDALVARPSVNGTKNRFAGQRQAAVCIRQRDDVVAPPRTALDIALRDQLLIRGLHGRRAHAEHDAIVRIEGNRSLGRNRPAAISSLTAS